MQMFLINNSRDPGPARQGVERSVRLGASRRARRRPGVPVLRRAAAQSIKVPGDESVSIGFDPGNPQVVLTGLTENLFPAQTITVTFQFAKAGSVTTKVPVRLTSPPSSPPIVNPTPTEG